MQTAQLQAITGTPWLVPLPKIVMTMRPLSRQSSLFASGRVSAQKEFDNVVGLANKVKSKEMEVKTSMAEQNESNAQLLDRLSQMKDATKAVEDAAADLSQNTEQVISSISDIGKKVSD